GAHGQHGEVYHCEHDENFDGRSTVDIDAGAHRQDGTHGEGEESREHRDPAEREKADPEADETENSERERERKSRTAARQRPTEPRGDRQTEQPKTDVGHPPRGDETVLHPVELAGRSLIRLRIADSAVWL